MNTETLHVTNILHHATSYIINVAILDHIFVFGDHPLYRRACTF